MEAMLKTLTVGPRSFYSPWVLWIVWVIWLPFLVPSIVQLVQPPVRASSILALAGNAVFVLLYCVFSFRAAQKLGGQREGKDDTTEATLVTLVLLALSVGTEILGRPVGASSMSLYVYTAAYAGSRFSIPRGIVTNFVVLAVSLAAGVLLAVELSELLQVVFIVPVVTFMTMSWTRSIVVGRKLHQAQGEIARLAAAEERLRIARDLHDLLGQKLSYIALKSELARHHVPSEPERAQAEIAEVESTARSTLHEVREAVAGYRKPDLSRELRLAAEVLSAAGIQVRDACDRRLVDQLPAAVNEALAWAVREGVTNVIRHSRAKTCIIGLGSREGALVMEIADDGSGGASAGAGAQGKGNGLRGLRERFAGLGGACEARSRPDGGFVLSATVPAGRAE
jgi:two-component system sensor histidine kinase DesK